jgi:hypothetical protein
MKRCFINLHFYPILAKTILQKMIIQPPEVLLRQPDLASDSHKNAQL